MGVFFIEFFRSLKKPTKYMLGRTLLFFAYLVFGALVFQAIESGAENGRKQQLESVKEQVARKYGISDRDLKLLVDEIEMAVDGGYLKADYDRWNFAGSLLFTSTVVTTIGMLHGAFAVYMSFSRLQKIISICALCLTNRLMPTINLQMISGLCFGNAVMVCLES